MINPGAFFKISYGLYIVCSGDKSRGNGYISNTVFQVSADPAKFAVCCNKNNFTAAFIQEYGVFSISVLNRDVSAEIFGKFGYRTGKDFDKLAGMQVRYGDTGVPIVLNESLAILECKVIQTVDAGTHFLFIGELVNAEILDEKQEPLTYQYYRQVKKGIAPKNAPTYVDKSKYEGGTKASAAIKYECPCCGYMYNGEVEAVKFEDLPDDWVCPSCGCEKADFIHL